MHTFEKEATLRKQSGFTLIELMISMVLGLLIVAATTQILVTSKNSVSAQQASSDIQADAIFGLATLKKSIRAVNYDAFRGTNDSEFILNDVTPAGGIALSVTKEVGGATVLGNILPKVNNAKLLSSSATIDDTNLKAATGTLKSDQLVLQYKRDTDSFDCEGNAVPAGYYVVERYFLRADTTTARSGEPNPLALACNAVHYGVSNTATGQIDPVKSEKGELKKTFLFKNTTAKINGDGTILMNRVDHFHFLLGIETGVDVLLNPSKSRVRYLTVSQYNSLTAVPKPNIVEVRVGLVVRSSNPSSVGKKNAEQRFTVLDQENLQLKDTIAAKSQYQREVYESTVLIRNGRG